MVLTSSFYLGMLINGLTLGVAAVGIGFLMYQCGLVMFGVAAFIGLPAYLLGIGSMHLGLEPQCRSAVRASRQHGVRGPRRRAGGARTAAAVRDADARAGADAEVDLDPAGDAPAHRRRRRADDDLQRHVRRPHAVAAREGRQLLAAGVARAVRGTHHRVAGGAFSLRPGVARDPGQRGAHALLGLQHLPAAARCLHRWPRSSLRCPAC